MVYTSYHNEMLCDVGAFLSDRPVWASSLGAFFVGQIKVDNRFYHFIKQKNGNVAVDIKPMSSTFPFSVIILKAFY